jgi:hypothetical protein
MARALHPPSRGNPMMDFLWQLRARQNRMVLTDQLTHKDLIKWLKIRVPAGTRDHAHDDAVLLHYAMPLHAIRKQRTHWFL